MLLPRVHWDGVADGSITVAFRRMRRPTVKQGGTLRTAVGVLAIDAVDAIEPEDITDAEARRAGHPDRDSALRQLRPEGTLYRIAFHVQGPDPRIALREQADLDNDELTAITARLDRFDRASSFGPWTRQTLAMIRDRPAVRAPDLAASVGRETLPFKRDVRKLKELGLTESLEVGYRLSPRGETLVRALGV
jgi:hypothetical protein